MLRVSEVYASAQGEGPNVGKTTVFVRFGGCNLRCPGWPCDTQHAIDPKYRNEWEKQTWQDLAGNIITVAAQHGANNITLTGGEPFLQPKDDLFQLCDALDAAGYKIDCFSNGTIMYPPWAAEKITFIMDWKLPGSGEDPYNADRIVNLAKLATSNRQHAVKFVIKHVKDFEDAAHLYKLWLKDIKNIEVFYGKVWDAKITDADLVQWVTEAKLPWRLNVQLHNIIWPVNERRR